MGVCIVYVSVYVFLCMPRLGICLYDLACLCAHAWLFALGLLHGFPHLQFFFFGLGVYSLTLVIWEWMLQEVMFSGGMLIVARVQCSVWTMPFLEPLGVCLGVPWLWFCYLPGACLSLALGMLCPYAELLGESAVLCKAVLCIVLISLC